MGGSGAGRVLEAPGRTRGTVALWRRHAPSLDIRAWAPTHPYDGQAGISHAPKRANPSILAAYCTAPFSNRPLHPGIIALPVHRHITVSVPAIDAEVFFARMEG